MLLHDIFLHKLLGRLVQAAKCLSNLFLLYGLQGRVVSPLFAGNESFSDVSGPLDLTGRDQHLKQEEYTFKEKNG